MNVLIVIPAYKNPEQLDKCKASIETLDLPNGLKVVTHVVDNNEENIGFTKAINKGLRVAVEHEYDLAIALNQDCYLDEDAVWAIADFMTLHPKCAIAGIKQISSEDPDQIIHAGCAEAFPYGKHITGKVSNSDHVKSCQVPWVNGACMVFRVSSLIEFGLMDENMFLLGSDSDICYSARSRGWEVWYIAQASCVHEQGVSVDGTNEAVEKIKFQDMLYWRSKWIGTDLYKELALEVFN
jgi:GT2 family glycosyltransferase